MGEQPVALATIMRSPNSWVTSFTYGVSPQPRAGAGELKERLLELGVLDGLGMRLALELRQRLGVLQFFSSAVWVARGFMTRRLVLRRADLRAVSRKPVQSSGETCMRKVRPLNFGPSAGLVAKVSGALALPSSSTM